MKTEQEIFEELANLCASPGYIYAISFLCFRDNAIKFKKNLTAEDMAPLFSESRLIRTEISTLIGLMLKQGLPDCSLPLPEVLQNYVGNTERLLEELHEVLFKPAVRKLPSLETGKESDFFGTGEVLRELIFYAPESAYSFQYRDLSVRKYQKDNEWLIDNKGFSIEDAWKVVFAIRRLQDQKITEAYRLSPSSLARNQGSLATFIFTIKEVVSYSGLNEETVGNVLRAFSIGETERNETFCALNDFNAANSHPLIPLGNDSFIFLQAYSLVEALYEAPYYWMMSDSNYINHATQHRGQFTEQFIHERLELVFDAGRVYSNVKISTSGKKQLGEIDVLVIFGDRAILVQAKSKRLTIEARKGNDNQVKDDFKKSIQDSYDQGLNCAKLLLDAKRYTFIDGSSHKVSVPTNLSEIYLLCVISDHYPALSFQSRQFLRYEKAKIIQPPFVLDIFTLDVMTEMLASPLKFISYLNRRVNYNDEILTSHELNILAYHLQTNLWIENEYEMVYLGDDICAALDAAMLVRREGLPGNQTPDGILTRLDDISIGRIIKHIEHNPEPATIDFGFHLLLLNEDTAHIISTGIDNMSTKAKADGGNHDMTLGFTKSSFGITIHCNKYPTSIAKHKLYDHCCLKKYSQSAKTWFGICIDPDNSLPRFGCNLDYECEQTPEMDIAVQAFQDRGNFVAMKRRTKRKNKSTQVGRNDPCPCGSGKKYKRCCISK